MMDLKTFKDFDLTELAELLQGAGEVQQVLQQLTPVIGKALPAMGDTVEVAIAATAVPLTKEFLKIASSAGMKEVLTNMAITAATLRASVAEAHLTEAGRSANAMVARKKAVQCKSQLDALREEGFTRKEAMEILGQLLLAQAMEQSNRGSQGNTFANVLNKELSKKRKPVRKTSIPK